MLSRTTEKPQTHADQQTSLQHHLYISDTSREDIANAYERLLDTWEVDFASRFVDTEFGETHVIETRPPDDGSDLRSMILVPGGMGTAAMWGPVMPTLSRHHQVFSIDLIDQVGRSRPTRVLQNHNDATRWMNQILEGLDLYRTSLMGNSIGSSLVANYAFRNPEKVDKLVLTAPAATFAPVSTRYILRALLAHISPFVRSKRRFLSYATNGRGALDTPLNSLLLSAMKGSRMISKLPPNAFTEREIGSFEVPTLAIFGERDGVNKLSSTETIDSLERLNPDIRCEMIPNAGHCYTTEDFELCAEFTSAFLNDDGSEEGA